MDGASGDLAPRGAEVLADHPEVDTAWLFGSRARGDARPGSDIDLAILFARCGMTPMEAALRRGRLMDELPPRLGAPVDVLDAERCSPRLFAGMYRDASLVVDRDPPHRIDVTA